METMKITGRLLLEDRLRLWTDAAEKIAPRTYELIICTRLEACISDRELPARVRLVRGTGKGYYALKNEGAASARGEVILFSDVDCRPADDYMVNLLRHFDETNAPILGGRSFYDGADFSTRASTVAAFGRLHGVTELPEKSWYLGHNVAVRKGSLPEFFGAYTGRYGGDEYMAETARQKQFSVPVYQDLILYHESATHTLRGLLDRHFREIVRTTFVRHGAAMTGWDVVREAARSGRQRWLNFKKYAGRFDFSASEKARARWLFKYYQFLDVLAAFAFVLSPRLLKIWQAYQFGDIATCPAPAPLSDELPESSFACSKAY